LRHVVANCWRAAVHAKSMRVAIAQGSLRSSALFLCGVVRPM